MQVILSHPTGNQNVRAILTSLFIKGMLAEFNTTIAVNPSSPYIKLLPPSTRAQWLRRTYPIPSNFINNYPLLELCRMLLPKIGFSRVVEHEKGLASIDSIYRNLDKIVSRRLVRLASKRNATAVYAYEDGALATFTKAKETGLKCIYDLPIAYWETGRKLMKEEALRLPLWAKTLGGGIIDSPAKLERKIRELELADVVIAPSEFVLSSLPAWATGKQVVRSPFGSPFIQEDNQVKEISATKFDKPVRVLFAGSMSQRKGLGDLFAAMRLLKRTDVELVVMGSLLAPIAFYRSQYSNFIHEVSRSNEQVLALMRSCDIFCLPSIVEGRALVMQEAMSQGLPLIITANTGGADLIIKGKTGFLVPIRSPQSIAEKLDWFADNRAAISIMGRNAKEHASHYTWEAYGANIINGLKQL